MEPWPDPALAAIAGLYTGAGLALIHCGHPWPGLALLFMAASTLWLAWHIAIVPYEED